MVYSKLERAIVYICYAFIDNPLKLGAVKLNKILWFSDCQSLQERKTTITHINSYVAQLLGPVIPSLPATMQSLYRKGIISSMREDFIDYQQWVYVIQDKLEAEICIEIIDEKEKVILDGWIAYARNNIVKKVVEDAHSYSWWSDDIIGNPIPVVPSLPIDTPTRT